MWPQERATFQPQRATDRFVYLAATISAIGGLLFGYDIGVIPRCNSVCSAQHLALSPGQEDIVVSAVLIGSLAGAHGRRRSRGPVTGGAMCCSALHSSLLWGCRCAALAPDMEWLVGARIVAGVAIGISSFVAPLYISYIAPARARGRARGDQSSRTSTTGISSLTLSIMYSPEAKAGGGCSL